MSKMVTADEQAAIMEREEMTERDEMRALAAAHGCDGECVQEYVRPVPCIRDEGGYIAEQPVKVLVAKIDEELNEFKAELCRRMPPHVWPSDAAFLHGDKTVAAYLERIAEEAADTITAITTLCEALGIDVEERDEAQRKVNNKNRKRGRL